MTAYHSSCPTTVRQFFDDFDLLPLECKELIWNTPLPPTLEDLKTAWELASQEKGLSHLIQRINVLKLTPAEKKAKADREREERKRQERESRYSRGRYTYREPILGKPKLKDVDPKHARLVQLVSEQQLFDMATKKKKVDDIKRFVEYERPILGYRNVTVSVKKDDTELRTPPKKERKQDVLKMLHNSVRG